MATLLQNLFIQTLSPDLDPVLLAYVETVLPAVEQEFGTISTLNGLLTAWNLLPFLSAELAPSDDEKRLLCLGFTFQGYNHCWQGNAVISLLALNTSLRRPLNLDAFWSEWREYWPEIGYLAQSTQQPLGKKSASGRKLPASSLNIV